jgi:predicted SnoaL-like aldol condensation-catalyzing enzyme
MRFKALLAVVVTIVLFHCVHAADKPEKAATKQAQAWLALIDEGKFGESWDESAKLFKASIPREAWIQKAGGARGMLGKAVSRRLKSARFETHLPGAPDGKYVVIQFDTAFEKKKKAIETVTPMQEADGDWRVSGYFIK